MVEIETSEPIDAGALRSIGGIRRIEQRGPTEIRATVDEASTILPEIVEAINALGIERGFRC